VLVNRQDKYNILSIYIGYSYTIAWDMDPSGSIKIHSLGRENIKFYIIYFYILYKIMVQNA